MGSEPKTELNDADELLISTFIMASRSGDGTEARDSVRLLIKEIRRAALRAAAKVWDDHDDGLCRYDIAKLILELGES